MNMYHCKMCDKRVKSQKAHDRSSKHLNIYRTIYKNRGFYYIKAKDLLIKKMFIDDYKIDDNDLSWFLIDNTKEKYIISKVEGFLTNKFDRAIYERCSNNNLKYISYLFLNKMNYKNKAQTIDNLIKHKIYLSKGQIHKLTKSLVDYKYIYELRDNNINNEIMHMSI